jgi:hypothetical protein
MSTFGKLFKHHLDVWDEVPRRRFFTEEYNFNSEVYVVVVVDDNNNI